MPWLAIPFKEHEVRSALSGRFSVMGIPRLVIVGPDGEASTRATNAVPQKPRRSARATAMTHASCLPRCVHADHSQRRTGRSAE